MRRLQFSMARLLLGVLVCATAIGFTKALGSLLGLFFIALSALYVLSTTLTTTAKLTCGLTFGFLSLLPWLGLGSGVMMYPGSEAILPTLRLPLAVEPLFAVPYAIAETPLYVLIKPGTDLGNVVFFAGEGIVTVRPFVVFAMWLAIAIPFLLDSLMSVVFKRVKARRVAQSPLPTDESGAHGTRSSS